MDNDRESVTRRKQLLWRHLTDGRSLAFIARLLEMKAKSVSKMWVGMKHEMGMEKVSATAVRVGAMAIKAKALRWVTNFSQAHIARLLNTNQPSASRLIHRDDYLDIDTGIVVTLNKGVVIKDIYGHVVEAGDYVLTPMQADGKDGKYCSLFPRPTDHRNLHAVLLTDLRDRVEVKSVWVEGSEV